MRKIFSTIAAFSILFTSCVKDEIYVPPTAEASDVVLNEIMSKDPVTDLDWVELYNNGDADVDISGYLINDKAEPTGGFVIPDGTIIPAKGFYVVGEEVSGIAVSSGGEDVSLGDASGKLIDYVAVPASPADGTTYGRIPDGTGDWFAMPDTKGAANAQVDTTIPTLTVNYNVAPAADSEVAVTLTYSSTATITEARIYYSVGDAPAYVKDNKIKGEDDATFTQTGVTILMKDVVTGNNLSVAGEKVSFYVRLAVDNNGDVTEYYFDKDGNRIADVASDDTDDQASLDFKADPTLWNTYTAIAGGVSAPTLAIVFGDTPTKMYETLQLSYTADIQINEVRVYFGYGDTPVYSKANRIKGEDDASFTQTDVTIDMSDLTAYDADETTVLGNTSDGSKISFYVRMALENGVEYYFDKDGNVIADDTNDANDDQASDDFKADPTQWNAYTSKDAVVVSKFDFNATPNEADDYNVTIEYASSETIVEARIYYAVGDSPVYIKANKVAGEDDVTFTQTGVTINMKGLDVEDADGNLVGTISGVGTKVSFYLRIATATSEYYFDKDGNLFVDDSPMGSPLDQSDDFKADPTIWNTFTIQ